MRNNKHQQEYDRITKGTEEIEGKYFDKMAKIGKAETERDSSDEPTPAALDQTTKEKEITN